MSTCTTSVGQRECCSSLSCPPPNPFCQEESFGPAVEEAAPWRDEIGCGEEPARQLDARPLIALGRDAHRLFPDSRAHRLKGDAHAQEEPDEHPHAVAGCVGAHGSLARHGLGLFDGRSHLTRGQPALDQADVEVLAYPGQVEDEGAVLGKNGISPFAAGVDADPGRHDAAPGARRCSRSKRAFVAAIWAFAQSKQGCCQAITPSPVRRPRYDRHGGPWVSQAIVWALTRSKMRSSSHQRYLASRS